MRTVIGAAGLRGRTPARIIAIFLIVAAIGRPVCGQEPQDVAASTAKPVYLHRTGTPEIHGQLLRLGPDTLTILEDGTQREIPLADVLRIDVSGDSVKNGALIGAIVLGGWCAFICAQGLHDYGQVAAAALVNAGLGALIGAGIDAAHSGRTTIYRKASGFAASRRVPGASLSISFQF